MGTNGSATAPPAAETGFLLEQEKRFSESILWQINRQYYSDVGPNAWHSGEVPSYATCNTYIAQAYANVVMAYLRDALTAGILDPKQPVYIVELAAGVGRFAYGFLRKLHMLKNGSSLRKLDVRYVMTDFTMTNVRAWNAHPLLKPFLGSGQLDLGTFDVDRDQEIKLIGGGVLSAQTVKNPLVVLGNYAFDTFRQDLFRVANGELHEVHVTTRSPHGQSPDLSRTDIISQLKTQYGQRAIQGDYYDDPALNKVLAHYRERLAETTIALPIGGFIGLRRLIDISGRRMLLLSSDKGLTHEDELYHPGQHSMQFHTGCLSMMVNYHAIGQYFLAQGGLYAATSGRLINLKTAACIIGGDSEQFADTLSMFRERIDTFGPSDFFELLQQERQDCRAGITVEHFLGLLRMSHWDPGLVSEYAGQVMNQAQNISETLQLELRLALERAWDNFFPGAQNLPFEIARIFMALRRPLEGIRFNQHALDMFGEQPVTYLNMGVCHYYAENPTEAMRCFRRSLELNPGFGLAKAWSARVMAEIERGRSGPAAAAVEPQPQYDPRPG